MSDNTKKTSPAKNEADDIETISFDVNLRGKTITLTVPADLMDASDEVLENFEKGHNLNAFYALIGPAQKARLRAGGSTGRFITEVAIPAWQEASGLGEG